MSGNSNPPPAQLAGFGPSPDWQDESWLNRFPQLSLAERDRRFLLARQLMEQEDLQCLILANPAQSHDFLGHYFANEATPTVVLPREGNPVAFQDGVTSPTARQDLELAKERFGGSWIADWRINEGVRGIAELIGHWDLADARIGCTGLQKAMYPSLFYMASGGAPWNPLPAIHQLSALLPQAGWVDIWPTLLPLIAVKSAEEIDQFKKASHLSERAAKIVIDSLKVGGTQAEALAEAAFDVFKHGAYTPSIGSTWPSSSRLGRADVVTDEIIVFVGAIEAQSGYTVCMGPPSQPMNRLIDAVHESYQLGVAATKPGMTMGELQEVMAPPFRKIGASNTPPLFHGLNPLYTAGEMGRFNEEDLPGVRARFFAGHEGELPFKPVTHPDIRFAPGMTLQLEMNGQKGTDKVFLGVNMLITADGNEEFSDISRRAHIKA
jgi:Xaa-Pro aminopeptidase